MTHTLWRRLAIWALLLSAAAPFTSGASALAHARESAAPAATQGWPTYLHDVARTSASAETILSTSNVAQLRAQWTYLTGGGIAASPTVVNGVAYVGSWDGYEYAINATTGALVWKTFLGQTTTPNCQPSTIGVTSAATVINGVVYVGGGDANWYALDAATGAVLWSVYTGDNSITGGHYNWSSPLIYNNYAYIGIASNCDSPLVQGQLLQVDLTTHQVVNTANFVPNGEVGGGIWSSPSLDTATNTIFVTTGTQAQLNEQMAQAIVALDASTLAIKSYWQIPLNQRGNDSDWGTTPLLFTDATGRQLVAAVNKNGVLYVYLRSNLSAGPVWEQRIALGGECPGCGDGGISSGSFANGVLYYAAGNTTINGVGYAGSVRAFDPATGNILWAHGDSQPVIAAIAYDNGLILDGVGSALEALDASTGTRLYTYATGGPIYSAPSVSGGAVFFGSTDNRIYSLALPTTIPTIPPDPHCPAGWTCQDINNTTLPGTESLRNGAWSVTGAGAGIRGTSDQFRLISQPTTGDTQVIAKALTEPTRSSAAQSGIIMRQSNDPGSPFYAVIEYASDTPDGVTSPTLKVLYRTAFGVTQAIRISPTNLPVYLMIQRVGDTFRAATSTDGSTYHVVPGSRVVLPLPATVLTGLAVDSGSAATLITDTFSQVSVGAPTIQMQQAVMPSPCPTNWNCYDVGNTSPVGSQTLSSSGQWTLLSTGRTISYYTDQFHFVYQSLTGDGSVQAHIVSQTNTAAGALAGVMLRQSLDPGSAYYGVFVTPSNGIVVQYRAISGLRSAVVASIAGTAPAYLRVTRYTDTTVSPAVTYYAAYTSGDGVTWSFVPWSAEAIGMGSTMLAGMVASTYASGTQSTVVMDTVSISSATTPPPIFCPSSWSCADIGYPDVAGAQMVSNGVFELSGTGNDIWNTYDQFHFVSQTLVADGAISAHITAQTYLNPWAKAGVMLRATTDPSSPFYAAYITPSNGLVVQFRAMQGASAVQAVQVLGVSTPIYIKVARYTDTGVTPAVTYFSTYTSSDGANWTLLAGSTVSLAMTGALQAGLAVTGHNGSGAASVATFDAVSLTTTAPVPPVACPASFSCGDIGVVAPTGSQTLSNGTWTIQGGGGDIWGTADSFHFVWQTLAADGSVSAQLTSQTNSSGWAKAGVMLRASNTANAPYYAIFLTPANGIAVQYRATAGGSAADAVKVAGSIPPLYLKVTRTGTAYTAYTSIDGVTWTLVAGSTESLPNLSGSLLAGMAVTSHNTGALSTAVFKTAAIG